MAHAARAQTIANILIALCGAAALNSPVQVLLILMQLIRPTVLLTTLGLLYFCVNRVSTGVILCSSLYPVSGNGPPYCKDMS